MFFFFISNGSLKMTVLTLPLSGQQLPGHSELHHRVRYTLPSPDYPYQFLGLVPLIPLLPYMMKRNWSVFRRRLKTPLNDYTQLREIAFLNPCLQNEHLSMATQM